MEVNEEGEAQTLQEQLMKAKEEASSANTEAKKASMKLNYCQTQLKEKQKDIGSNSQDYENDKINLELKEKEVASLEVSFMSIFWVDIIKIIRMRNKYKRHGARSILKSERSECYV